jgi:hypothetical protein
VARVARLLTLVDLVENEIEGQMSFSARHEAELEDGRRLLLLDDRGWTSSLLLPTANPPSVRDVADFWAAMSVEEIMETSRWVVGADEPFGGRSQDDMERDHRSHLAEILRQQSVAVDADELKALPHDVVLSERLLAILGRDPGGPVPTQP